jgi:pentatricopeptide repeat-containing protein PET309
MIGDLQQATHLATLLHSTAVGPQEKDWGVKAYESILLSTHAHFDAIQVLEFLVMEWDQAAMYIMRSSARRNSIRRFVNSILEEIDKPAQVLASRRSWSEVRRRCMSDLLLDALCERGYPECAYALYQEMRKQSIFSPEAQRLVLVRALVRADLFEKANNLFTSILVNESRFYLSTALYLFANQGQISRAQEYYTRLEKHGETSPANLAMLLQAHAVHGNVEEVVTLFNRFFPRSPAEALFDAPSEVRTSRVPNNIHYTIVIHAHAVRGDFNGMNAWLEKMCKAGLSPDAHTFTVILKAFARRGDLSSVGVILDQMRASGLKPGCATYTVVLTLLAERKDPVAAEGIYKRAVGEGVVPDRRLITSVMHAHVEAGSWRGVIRVFDYLKSVPTRRLRLTIEVYNTLLKAYVLIGAPFRIVSNIFGKLESAHVRPDAHTFALLIQSACDSGLMNVACDLFLEMDKLSEQWESNISINAYVLTIIMSGFLRVGEKARASAIYEDMQKRGIEPTSVTFGNILRAYANVKSEESLAIAEAFLKKLVETSPGERTWTKPAGGRRTALEQVYLPLMNVYSKRGDPDQVERLYRGLLEAGGEPSLGTIVALLDAYRHNGNTEAAVRLWPQICQLALQQSDINPLFQGESNDKPSIHRQVNILCVPLSIYIDVLSAAGLHGEIYTVWRSLQVQGFAFDSHNWNHLAVALVRAGQPERAFEILEKVILPYQAQSMRLLPTRDDKPPTPLTFDENPPQPNTPASSAPLHHTERRAKMSKASYKALHRSIQHIGEDKSDDFAHPLHILHQISPTWNDWRPHTIVVRVLIMVLDHLESGMVVRPVRAGDDKIMATGDTERREANRAAAAEMLARIYENYPQAVSTVRDYEYKFRLQGWPIWPE